MILYERTSWLAVVFRLHGSAFPRVWPRILVTTLIASAFTAVQHYEGLHFSLTVAPFLITGLPLGIILGFRNSSSYERFWEGRKLWGALVNQCRSLVRQLYTFVRAPVTRSEEPSDHPGTTEAVEAFRREVAYRLVAFVVALRMHLRRESDPSELAPLLSAAELDALASEPSPPAAILHRIGLDLRDASLKKWIHSRHLAILESTLVQLTDVVGGCERIKNTPTPISYIIFIHRAVAVYALLLPFGLAETIHSLTPVVVFFISYAFFSLDAVGDELDDPFKESENTLPIASITRSVEIYVRKRLGETSLPKPLGERNGVLH